MMALNLVVSVVMIGSVLLAYRQKLEWNDAKPLFMVTVPLYVTVPNFTGLPSFTLFSLLHSVYGALWFSLVHAPSLASRYVVVISCKNENETLRILSPYHNKAVLTGKKAPNGRPILNPPTYEILVHYTRTAQGRTLAKREGRIPIGHFGTFFH